ncbi:MAG: 5'/3'-nucleotidase SurE [Tannerella sp.]|jgi:5'-nucleotidase|nr:5'/3'-nucleotidase SurE [Tannerella sp.]
MTSKQPLILITNDDGVEAEGIRSLAEAMRPLGEVTVFAPDGPRSGMSCAITTEHAIRYSLIGEEPGMTVYSCTGTPVDCVKLALNEVVPRKPDLLLSGINHGGNHALSTHYSGTMGAAFEGCVFDVPSIGVSLYDYFPGADFGESCRLAILLAEDILQRGLPHGVYLNLNIPNRSKVKGIVTGRQTDGKWVREFRREKTSGEADDFYITGYYKTFGPDRPDNDVALLEAGYASLVPCNTDITDYSFVEILKDRYYR